MEPATLSLLSLQTRQGARNSVKFNGRSPSGPGLSSIARGAGGGPQAMIPDNKGLTKAEQGMGANNNKHRQEEGNKGQGLGL